MPNLDFNEALLIHNMLIYEQGHARRTRHLLSVYAIANSLGQQAGLATEALYILKAAALLHDIAIKHCKDNYNGDASQSNQRREAPRLVSKMLTSAHYPTRCITDIIHLVNVHHCYDNITSRFQQLLIEADLIVNCLEAEDISVAVERVKPIFKTSAGLTILQSLS